MKAHIRASLSSLVRARLMPVAATCLCVFCSARFLSLRKAARSNSIASSMAIVPVAPVVALRPCRKIRTLNKLMDVNHARTEQVLSVSLRLLDLLEVPEEGQQSYRRHLSRSSFAVLYWCFPLQGAQSVEIRQQLVRLLPFEHRTRYWRCWRYFTNRIVSLE